MIGRLRKSGGQNVDLTEAFSSDWPIIAKASCLLSSE